MKRVNNVSVNSFKRLKEHVGHDIECVTYGNDGVTWNVAIECKTCNEVLMDFDATEDE